MQSLRKISRLHPICVRTEDGWSRFVWAGKVASASLHPSAVIMTTTCRIHTKICITGQCSCTPFIPLLTNCWHQFEVAQPVSLPSMPREVDRMSAPISSHTHSANIHTEWEWSMRFWLGIYKSHQRRSSMAIFTTKLKQFGKLFYDFAYAGSTCPQSQRTSTRHSTVKERRKNALQTTNKDGESQQNIFLYYYYDHHDNYFTLDL